MLESWIVPILSQVSMRSMNTRAQTLRAACFLVVTLLFPSLPVVAADDAASVPTAVRDKLSMILPGQHEADVKPSPVSGLYEVGYGGEVFYLTADGRYMLRGDLLDLASMRNLSEERRSAYRRGLMAEIDPKKTINFAPEPGPAKHVVYVFTDIDCPYCRRMHKQIADYERLGIEIR